MKYINLKKHLAVIAVAAFSFSACKKISTPEPMGDAGQTIVKLIGGGASSTEAGIIDEAINFVNTSYTLKKAVVDIRRDVPSNSALNSTTVLTIKDDTSAIAFFNRDTVSTNPNRTNPDELYYYQLPTAWYTVKTSSNIVKTGGQGGSYSVTFNPGEFAKQIQIVIPDATVLDPSNLYALAFTITTIDASGKISNASRSVILQIGAKNDYDGVYSLLSGTVTRYTSPGVPAGDVLSGPLAGNPDIILITSGAYSCAIPPAGVTGGFFWAYGNNSMVAGIDGLTLTVDPNTNLTNMVSAGNATLTNWAGHPNFYDPTNKTFSIAFRWNPAAATREYDVIFKYKTAR